MTKISLSRIFSSETTHLRNQNRLVWGYSARLHRCFLWEFGLEVTIQPSKSDYIKKLKFKVASTRKRPRRRPAPRPGPGPGCPSNAIFRGNFPLQERFQRISLNFLWNFDGIPSGERIFNGGPFPHHIFPKEVQKNEQGWVSADGRQIFRGILRASRGFQRISLNFLWKSHDFFYRPLNY